MNPYSKEELVAYASLALEAMRAQFNGPLTREERVAADRLEGAFGEIIRILQGSTWVA